MNTLTSTATKVVSNTKLAIATLAMLGAGSIALATVPMTANSSYGWSGCFDGDNNEVVYGPINPFNAKQLFTKAVTAYNSGAKTDYCYTFPTKKTYLMEGICSKGNFSTWQKNCAELNLGKTGVNYQCVDGACVNKAATTTPNNSTCTDSDGGKNYNVQGTVKFSQGPNYGYSATDSCKSEYGLTMTEQYCENNLGKTEIVTCPNGCKDGACVNVATSTLSFLLLKNSIPTNLVNGTRKVASFKLAPKFAPSVSDFTAKFKELKLYVYTNIVSTNNWELIVNDVLIGSGQIASSTITFSNLDYFFGGNLIKTFDVYANVMKANTPGSAIQVSIPNKGAITVINEEDGTPAEVKATFPFSFDTLAY